MKRSKTTPCDTWGIRRESNGRYVIIDTTTGKVLDDIQGHGCKTYDKARKYGRKKYGNEGQCDGEPNADVFNTLF